MNPFEVLGMEPTLDVVVVKQAYFAALRKYPPHEHPSRFQHIRAAYDSLSSEQGLKSAYAQAPVGGDDILGRFRAQELLLLEQAKEKSATAVDASQAKEGLFAWASKRSLCEVLQALSSATSPQRPEAV